MRLIKTVLIIGVVASSILYLSSSVLAQADAGEPDVIINFFWRDGCSHCAAEKPVLQELIKKYPQIELRAYEVFQNSINRDFLFALGEAMKFETKGIPVTIIGDQVWTGYHDSYSTEMENAVISCLSSGCPDPSDALAVDRSQTIQSLEVDETAKSAFPLWIFIAAVVIILSYGCGVYIRKRQKKHTAKKHHH